MMNRNRFGSKVMRGYAAEFGVLFDVVGMGELFA